MAVVHLHTMDQAPVVSILLVKKEGGEMLRTQEELRRQRQ